MNELNNDMLAQLLKAFQTQQTPRRKGKKSKRVASTPELKAERMAANDAECIKVFTAAGFQDVQPRINVLTYGKVKPDGSITGWLSKGRKVKAGEHGHRVGIFNLFHVDQTAELEAVQ